jgi:hypothetical protein
MKNFVNEDSLRAFHPRISEYVGKGRVDFSFQIGEGFRQTLDALRARGLKARQISKPLDILRPYQSTAIQNYLTTSGTKTASEAFTFIEGLDGFVRFVVSVSALNVGNGEQYTFILEASDDQNVDLANPPATWREVARLTAKASGDLSTRFTDEGRFYRLRLVTATTGGPVQDTPAAASASVAFTAWLQETTVERLTTYRALALIMAAFSTDPNDVWAKRADESNQAFETALAGLAVNVDTDGDNVPTETEGKTGFGVVFGR